MRCIILSNSASPFYLYTVVTLSVTRKAQPGHLFEIIFDLQSAKIIILGIECNYGQQEDDNKK